MENFVVKATMSVRDSQVLRYVKAWVQNLMKSGTQNNVSMHFNLLSSGNLNEI